MGIHVTKELIGFFFVQKRPHTSVYLFRDKHVGGMRVRVDGAGRRFVLLCHSLSLFESQLDHCLSPFPALIHCRSITERAIHTSLSNAGLARVLLTEAEHVLYRMSQSHTRQILPIMIFSSSWKCTFVQATEH